MHSPEDDVCDNSMVNRKKRLSQNAKLASCCNRLLGKLPRPANELAGIGTHISAAPSAPPARCTGEREVSKTDLAGKTQVSGSVAVTQELGITLILKNGHCQTKWCIISTTSTNSCNSCVLSLTEILVMAELCLSTF